MWCVTAIYSKQSQMYCIEILIKQKDWIFLQEHTQSSPTIHEHPPTTNVW